MMANLLFLLTLGAVMALWLGWACRVLPGERWQFLAAIPTAREPSGIWRGVNLLSAPWNPGMIVALQLTWAALFLYMGCSMVTGSSLSFHVHRERV